MKKNVLLLIACAFLILDSNAQIGVGNLKGKVVDKTSKKEKESPSGSTTNSTGNSTTKSNPDSEKQALNSRYNNELSNSRTTISWIAGTASKLMDPRSGTKYYLLKDDDNIGKVRYDSIRSAYLAVGYEPNDASRNIQRIDTFYTIYPRKLKEEVLSENTEAMKKFSANSKEARSRSNFLQQVANREIDFFRPEGISNEISDYQVKIRKALLFMPGDADLLEIIKEADALKADYAEYRTSGEYEKNVAAVKEIRLDNVRCPKAVNTNAALIAVVKKDFETSAEKFLRASITSSDWKVNKNSYGNLSDRTMTVFVVYTTPDGKCLLEEGELYSRYTGGKWENAKFHFVGKEPREMLSKNAQK